MPFQTHLNFKLFTARHKKIKVQMAAFLYTITLSAKCSTNVSNNKNDPRRLNQKKTKINGTKNRSITVDTLGQAANITNSSLVSIAENGYLAKECIRQNIPTKKQYVDQHRQGLMFEKSVGYRQTVVIRSYEVGPDKTATLESILNLLQETALNHVWMSGLLSNGFGATHGMVRNSLIWVVSRMHVEVDHYPIWGEIVEIDTWVGASGKNGMRRDWLIRSQQTGHIFARATSTWVMMNDKTRRLSKMPEEVRDEISPWFIDKQAIKEDVPEKISKLDDQATYMLSDLKPKRSDLDMNQHVNNVKYVRWMLEAIPDEFLESYQLSGIILEYKRECGASNIVQSLCEPGEEWILNGSVKPNAELPLLNGFSLASEIMQGNGLLLSLDKMPKTYTHLLQMEGDTQNEEILRGKTMWKKKKSNMPFSCK